MFAILPLNSESFYGNRSRPYIRRPTNVHAALAAMASLVDPYILQHTHVLIVQRLRWSGIVPPCSSSSNWLPHIDRMRLASTALMQGRGHVLHWASKINLHWQNLRDPLHWRFPSSSATCSNNNTSPIVLINKSLFPTLLGHKARVWILPSVNE
jgi:hypothetical protein